MGFIDVFVIVILPVAAVVAAVLFGVVMPKMQRQQRLHGPIPVALGLDADVIPPRPERPLATNRPSPAAAPVVPQPAYQPPAYPPPAAGYPPQAVYAQAAYAPAANAPIASAPPNIQVAAATGTHGGMPPEARAASTLETPHLRLATTPSDTAAMRAEGRLTSRRRERPIEGTLQFLPGRLEVVDGRDVGQEIRFVRQPGEDGTVVTFGRSEGAPYRHVQLHEPTVSRVHARMSLEGKRWRLTNMSKTNPVVVNGQPLEGEEASMVLTEGDRVEMGEVVFTFRAK